MYFFGLFFIFFFYRVLGSLLSAHLIIKDPLQPFGDMVPLDYDNELLLLAHDIANRLMAAFETATKIPYPRVSRCDYHSNLITPKHQYAYSLYPPLYISQVVDKENLFNKLELL